MNKFFSGVLGGAAAAFAFASGPFAAVAHAATDNIPANSNTANIRLANGPSCPDGTASVQHRAGGRAWYTCERTAGPAPAQFPPSSPGNPAVIPCIPGVNDGVANCPGTPSPSSQPYTVCVPGVGCIP